MFDSQQYWYEHLTWIINHVKTLLSRGKSPSLLNSVYSTKKFVISNVELINLDLCFKFVAVFLNFLLGTKTHLSHCSPH